MEVYLDDLGDIALGETSRKEPDPIPQEQFFNRGYETLFNLLAITGNDDPHVLLPKRVFEKVFAVMFNAQRSPLAPLEKEGNRLKVPLKKRD